MADEQHAEGRPTYQVGDCWMMKVNGRLTIVRLGWIGIAPGHYNPSTQRMSPIRWRAEGVNLATGKKIHIKSRQKLRTKVCEKCKRAMTRCVCQVLDRKEAL